MLDTTRMIKETTKMIVVENAGISMMIRPLRMRTTHMTTSVTAMVTGAGVTTEMRRIVINTTLTTTLIETRIAPSKLE